LEGLLKELQANCQNRVTGVLAFDYGQLIEVMLVTIMGFANIDDPSIRHLFNQSIHAD
jgi:hypothetical protein